MSSTLLNAIRGTLATIPYQAELGDLLSDTELKILIEDLERVANRLAIERAKRRPFRVRQEQEERQHDLS